MTGKDDSPGALMAEVLAGVSRLVQGELALARAEVTARLQSAKRAVVQIVIAVVLVITAINLLAAGAVAAVVALGLAPLWATITVGVILMALAIALALQATRLMRDVGSPPRRSAVSLRRDLETLKKMVKPDATA